PEHVQVGPAVGGLPDQVGSGQRRGEQRADDQVAAAQQVPFPGGGQGGPHGQDQEADVPLGFGAHAHGRPDGQPPARVLAGQQVRGQQQGDRPEHQVGGGGGQLVGRAQELPAGRGGQRGQDLTGPARAHAAAHSRVGQDQRAQGQPGHHPETDQVVAGGQLAEPGQQRGQRRLVDVAESPGARGGQGAQISG